LTNSSEPEQVAANNQPTEDCPFDERALTIVRSCGTMPVMFTVPARTESTRMMCRAVSQAARSDGNVLRRWKMAVRDIEVNAARRRVSTS
jgi:hypothetical protein